MLPLYRTISREVSTLTDHCSLSVDELCALARLRSQLYMYTALRGGVGEHADNARPALKRLGETVIDSYMDTDSPREQALLATALFHLSRTGVADYTRERLHCDRAVVANAMESASPDTATLHAAMTALTQQPLTRIVFDTSSPSLRRYDFSLGGGYYERSLRTWARTQRADGSWSGVSTAEALVRLSAFESDFGSLPGIDNRRVSASAYRFYSAAPCTTPTALYALYHSCVRRWGYATQRDDMLRFLSRSQSMLSSGTASLSDRLTLHSVMLSASARLYGNRS